MPDWGKWRKTLIGDITSGDQPDGDSQEASSADSTRVPQGTAARRSSLDTLKTGPSASVYTRTAGISSGSTSSRTDDGIDRTISEMLNDDSKELGFSAFEASLKAVSTVETDRTKAVRLAIVTTTATNPKFTSDQIVRAIEERLRLLDGYESEYRTKSADQQQAESADKTTAVQSTKDQIADIEREIARLGAERDQLVAKATELDRERSTIASKYEDTLARFTATVGARRTELRRLVNLVAGKPQTEGN